MDRRTFLSSMAAFAQGANRPNVLFVAVDDLNTDLGCYGHPLVRTPNIDEFARRAVRFDHAYCQYPVCNPSRTSFLSGRYPDATGVVDNTVNPRTTLKDSPFLPELLRRNGYFTARVGKIFHDGMDGEQDWDVSLNPRPANNIGRQGEGRNLTGGKFGFFEWRAADGTDEDQADGLIAAEAIKLLEQKRDKPFFLAVGLRKPHDAYIAPKKYFEQYPLDKFSGPLHPADDESDIPKSAYPPVRHNLGTLEGREYARAYAACTSFMDAQFGKVMRALNASSASRNTLVIFFGDHGLHLGEHNWWNKVTLFERSVRVPLLIAGPPVSRPGSVSRRAVQLVDLYPTVAEFCGVSKPAKLDGASLQPLLSNPEVAWDRPAYTIVTRGSTFGRSVATERYRYTEWDGGRGGVEMYDHNIDPNEYRNVVELSDYKEAKGKLQEQLRRVSK